MAANNKRKIIPDEDRLPQVRKVVRALAKTYPDAYCALIHRNVYELTVATILSAQCTDARVNLVTPALFLRFPDAVSLARADVTEVETLIRSTGFFHAKAKNLVGMAMAVVENHGGEIPDALEKLVALPGVGRKTAHVVLGNAFGIASGVVVDTHVKRLSYRLGMTDATDPEKIERDLNATVPRKEWVNLSHRLIDHGRKICVAIRPKCGICPFETICPKRGVA